MKTFVDFVAERYLNKEVEVYLGDSKTTHKLAELDHSIKSLIRGIVVEGTGECLILDVNGAEVLLNSWSIKLVVPVAGSLFVKDIFQDEHKGFVKSFVKKK